MICFNVPPCIGSEVDYIADAISNHRISGDGKYTKLCSQWLEDRFEEFYKEQREIIGKRI